MKATLQVGTRSILARQLEALRAAGAEQIVLIGRWIADVAAPVPVVADAVDEGAALGGVYTALLVSTADRVLVLAGDMPFVTPVVLRRLLADAQDADACVPKTRDGLHPLCGCYHRRIAHRLKAQLDRSRLGIQDALTSLDVRLLDANEMQRLDPDDMMLMNVNTPLDYERACRLATGDGPPRRERRAEDHRTPRA